MRQKNPELMEQIIKYVDHFYEANGRSPNIAEIASALKVNRSQVHRYLVFLEEKGLVEYSRDAIKTETMMKMARSNVTSIVGTIPCGPPDVRYPELVDEFVSLPVTIFGEGNLYILRAQGDSMIEAGIDDGDLVVVRAAETANVGDIIAALTIDQESTLKRLIEVEGKRALHPENPTMEDIDTPFQIQGVAIYVMKKIGSIL